VILLQKPINVSKGMWSFFCSHQYWFLGDVVSVLTLVDVSTLQPNYYFTLFLNNSVSNFAEISLSFNELYPDFVDAKWLEWTTLFGEWHLIPLSFSFNFPSYVANCILTCCTDYD
jgi:hypothetical protein